MATFLQEIEAKLIIKEIQYEAAAKAKIDEMTRIRLGLAPGAAVSKSDAKATAKAMGAAGIGGQSGIMGMVDFAGLIAGVTGLTSVIMMAIANSKIIAMLSQTIGKALGLLVDVILMPFLPIFMILLVGLFKAIMAFHKLWSEFWSTGAGKTIIDWMKKALGFTTEPSGDTAEVMIKANEDAKWWKDLITKGYADISANFSYFLEDPVKWFYENMNKTVEDTGNVLNFMVKFTENIFYTMLDFLYRLWSNPSGTLFNLFFTSNIDSIYSIWQKMFGGDTGGTGGGGAGGRKGSDRDFDFTPPIKHMGFYPGAATGGYVQSTGIAKIHKGETITPAGQGGVTVNITGQFKSDEDMYRRFVDRLRQEQWRTNV